MLGNRDSMEGKVTERNEKLECTKNCPKVQHIWHCGDVLGDHRSVSYIFGERGMHRPSVICLMLIHIHTWLTFSEIFLHHLSNGVVSTDLECRVYLHFKVTILFNVK